MDNINKNLRAMEILNFTKNDLSSTFIISIYLFFKKFDQETQKSFESTFKDKGVPKLYNFFTFVENRTV